MLPAMSDEFFLSPSQVRRAFDRASATYDAAAGVPAEIRARLLERLDIVRLQPRMVLDLGAGTGHASRALKQRYRTAEILAMDLSGGMLVEANRRQSWWRRFHRLQADAHRLPLPDASVDLVFSNLLLQWCHDPDAVFQEIARVLRPGGLLNFATLGPDTLRELRAAWRSQDPHVHVHRFIDMHDLGDALLRAGLAEPVMDTERLTVTYPDADALLRELGQCGGGNLAAGRPRGLTGKGRLAGLRQALEPAPGEPLKISVEVVYGHAWAQELRRREPTGEVRIPFSQIGHRR